MSTKHTPTRDQELTAAFSESMRIIGEAGKILEQMEEFWANGTPVRPGSLLALEFSAWGKRVMTGPQRATPDTYKQLLAACKQAESALNGLRRQCDEREWTEDWQNLPETLAQLQAAIAAATKESA